MFKKLQFPSQICKGKNNLERYETVARSRFQTLSTFANVESSFCHIEWYLIRIEAMVWLSSLSFRSRILNSLSVLTKSAAQMVLQTTIMMITWLVS